MTPSAIGTRTRKEVTIIASRPLVVRPCPSVPDRTTTVGLGPPVSGATLGHAPTGPVVGLYTSVRPDAFTDDDGGR